MLVALLTGYAQTLSGGGAGPAAAGEGGYRYELRNPLHEPREEVVALPLPPELAGAAQLAAFDADTGAALPFQRRAAEDDPGHALIQVALDAGARRAVRIAPAAADSSTPLRAFGRHVPERKDDFTWENDRIAFRVYGPALAATGEVSSGIDVWAKRVRVPVLDRWYANDDYHSDHGEGLDFYKVGPSRGCGGLAMREGGQVRVSGNYVRWRRLVAGPLRVAFELDYAPWGLQAQPLVETKRITLDAGSNFSRIQARFANADGAALPLIAGLHLDGGQPMRDPQGRWIGVWGAPDPKHGSIGCAVVLAGTRGTPSESEEHLWLGPDQPAGKPFVYYAGASWSQGLDVRNAEQWQREIAAFARRLAAPVQVGLPRAEPGP